MSYRDGWIQEFDQQHGERVIVNDMVYFADGAFRQNHPEGSACHGSNDPRQRAEAIERYHRYRYEQAREDFNKDKRDIMAHVNGDVLLPESRVENLAKLRDVVRARQVAWDEAKAALEKFTPAYLHAAALAEKAQRVEAFRKQVDDIKI